MALDTYSIKWTDAFYKGLSSLLFSFQKIIAMSIANGAHPVYDATMLLDFYMHLTPGPCLAPRRHGPCLLCRSLGS